MFLFRCKENDCLGGLSFFAVLEIKLENIERFS